MVPSVTKTTVFEIFTALTLRQQLWQDWYFSGEEVSMAEREIIAALEEEKKDRDDPTGACTINSGGIEKCQTGLTQKGCGRAAAAVNGVVVSWVEGGTCS